ncbi:hypothetical protein LX87_01969 [Larkinella arboricola]|uniref:Uncharacterized protein n=1 Tax=Larkinella arboricola TaxID=643671 RepID=A0A327X3L4_LARAB|nr:hypothetical protein [Larkinella arboricola]RAK00269.1 hypothetical protein LX87_01969 [Larkinella arboricola]
MKAPLFSSDPEGNGSPKREDRLNPDQDEPLTHDLTDDETVYQERGDIRRGIPGEEDPTDDGLMNDIRTSDDENVTPGS